MPAMACYRTSWPSSGSSIRKKAGARVGKILYLLPLCGLQTLPRMGCLGQGAAQQGVRAEVGKLLGIANHAVFAFILAVVARAVVGDSMRVARPMPTGALFGFIAVGQDMRERFEVTNCLAHDNFSMYLKNKARLAAWGRFLIALPKMRPELQQIAFGDDPLQPMRVVDRDGGVTAGKERVGFVDAGRLLKRGQGRSLPLGHSAVCNILASSNMLKKLCLGQAADDLSIRQHRQL